jgi:hypothetical protein
MKFNNHLERATSKKRATRWIYTATFAVMGFTGFGQMPIFKRYYIADIPGMAWAADFYLTHRIHYLGAIFLFAFVTYVALDYLLTGRGTRKLTASAYIRIALLGGLIITGIFRVLKNLPDVTFSPNFTLFIDLSHLGFMMVYLLTALFFLIIKSGWIARETI